MNSLPGRAFLRVSTALTVLVLLAGCTSAQVDRGAERDGGEPAADVDPVVAVEIGPTVEFIEAAAAYIDSVSHRYEGFVGPAPGAPDAPPGLGDDPLERGESDGTITSSTIDVSPAFGFDSGGRVVRYSILDGSRMFIYDPIRTELTSNGLGPPAVRSAMDLAADDWVVVDWSRVDPETPIETSSSARDLTAGFAFADEIIEGPAAVDRGVETRVFVATVPGSRAFATSEDEDNPLAGMFEGPDVELAVHVDSSGVIRQVRTTLSGMVERRVEFFDVGADITIELPDALDITDQLLAERAAFEEDGSVRTAPPTPPPTSTPRESLRPGEPMTILDQVWAQPELSTLRSLIEEDPIVRDFLGRTSQSWTLFAPTNDAFAALGEPYLAGLRNDAAERSALLYRLVVQGPFDADDLDSMSTITTLGGAEFDVVTDRGFLEVGGAAVLVSNDALRNGVVHIVSSVLPPPEL